MQRRNPLHNDERDARIHEGSVQGGDDELFNAISLCTAAEEFYSTPPGWAALWGRAEMVTLLLERGARTNLSDDLSWATPLAWAAKKGHAEIERQLREAGTTS